MTVGFIGLGVMGRPMALNLVKAGFDVVVGDHHQDRVDEVVHEGARAGGTASQIAAQADVVVTMLQDSPQVREVVLGPGGIVEGAHAGLTYIDASSVAPSTSREVSAALAEVGVPMLDAPVSGGEPFAVAGTLAFMVGGPQDVFDANKPLLSAMGKSVVRIGDVGSGNIAKLANQAIVAVNIAVLAEALVLAEKAGADPEVVVEAISGGLAGSNVMNAKAPLMLEHRFDPGFRIDLHHKDLANVLRTAHETQSPAPLTAAVFEMFSQLRATGHGGEDHSALVRVAEAASGTTIAGRVA